MSYSASNASDSGNDLAKARATKSMSRLSPEQLARKRANDRESQRAIRARNKDLIASLQREVHQLRSRDDARAVQELLRRNEALESELSLLRRTMGLQPQPGRHDDIMAADMASLNAFPAHDCTMGFASESIIDVPRRLESPSSVWPSAHHGSDQGPMRRGAAQHDPACSSMAMANSTENVDACARMAGLLPAHASTSAPGVVPGPKPHMSVNSVPHATQHPGAPTGLFGHARQANGQQNEGYDNFHYLINRDAHGGPPHPLHESGLFYSG